MLDLPRHLGRPLDVISSPAANVAVALGIDSMIHLVTAVRRRRLAGELADPVGAEDPQPVPAVRGAGPTLLEPVMGLEITTYGPLRPLHSGHYGNWAPNPIMQLSYLLTSMRDEAGRILVDGYYDDVPPPTELELDAIANMPDVTETLKDELSVHTPEGDIEERLGGGGHGHGRVTGLSPPDALDDALADGDRPLASPIAGDLEERHLGEPAERLRLGVVLFDGTEVGDRAAVGAEGDRVDKALVPGEERRVGFRVVQ
mgnify:CR=1 FL=1